MYRTSHQPPPPRDRIGSAILAAPAAGTTAVAGLPAEKEAVRLAHAVADIEARTADGAHFVTWCARFGAIALPADPRLVARYLSAHAGDLKVVTLQRRLSAIHAMHRQARLDFDGRHRELRETWRGIRRTHGVASRGKAPTVTEELRALLDTLDPSTLLGLRDRALLLIGFAGCYRRSELVAIDHAHVAEHRDGLIITLTSLEEAQQAGRLSHRLKTLVFPSLLVVDEIGYLPITRTGAMPFFQLMSRRYERASTVLTSNKSFEEWGEIFGDEVMATALIDRLVHHCHIVNMRGNSYRMKNHAALAAALRHEAPDPDADDPTAPTPRRARRREAPPR